MDPYKLYVKTQGTCTYYRSRWVYFQGPYFLNKTLKLNIIITVESIETIRFTDKMHQQKN